ncbi:hypothetical protein GIB67_011323 [Kingdonia uniflora]|uniref:Uncharacterized protein n=1 Tax=Kingdonia uniflora TaxID=39325 RepID=A0A7J7MP36_9MAGN|nr:hypothetical protein GIB67_011323 [Kingdonia uniflora]
MLGDTKFVSIIKRSFGLLVLLKRPYCGGGAKGLGYEGFELTEQLEVLKPCSEKLMSMSFCVLDVDKKLLVSRKP